jgi:MoaA/NifB/PqqE/SkfB family radical SAM enzyme
MVVIYKYKNLRKIRLDVSSVCQLKCKCCTTGNNINKFNKIGYGFLSFNNFKNFILNNINIKEIELSNFGEIFLNSDLIKIIKFSDKFNIKLYANNGVNLNLVSNEVLKSLIKYKFHLLRVSIDGATNYVYKKYRVGGDLNNVINNIKKINYYKKKFNSKYPILIWQFILFNHNIHEYLLAKKIAKKLNMKFWVTSNWYNKFSPINKSLVLKNLLKKEDYLNYKNSFKENGIRVCQRFYKNPQINWDGKLMGCCINNNYSFGNVFTGNFQKIFESNNYQMKINKIINKSLRIKNFNPCKKCEFKLYNYWG